MKSSIPKFKVKPGYKPQSPDTTPEVDLLGFELLKKRSPSQRLVMGAEMNKNARRFSISCFRQHFSQLSDAELAQKLAFAWLGENDFPGLTSTHNQMNWIQDSIALAEKLHPIFELLNIPYYITGGVAAIGFATALKRNRLRGSSDNSGCRYRYFYSTC
ncbi:hypothetical protein ACL6C3_14395 [Capilliphycus salinus ALCB114379]|uniref:hypothetical protein n=1 Tax=Capilliphycus salinus TaxID=2768948 RepID=UPI0039A750FD